MASAAGGVLACRQTGFVFSLSDVGRTPAIPLHGIVPQNQGPLAKDLDFRISP